MENCILAENVEKLRNEKEQLVRELSESNKRNLSLGQTHNNYSIENKENYIKRDSVSHASGAENGLEIEKLRNENESLLAQRNQLSKKMESLQRELENIARNKGPSDMTANNAIIERLQQTNSKLIEENGRLMEQLREREIERMSETQQQSGSKILRERIMKLEDEKEHLRTEKDKLLVEFSRMSVSQKKKIFD